MVSWKKSFLYFIIMVTGYPSIWVEYFFLPLHYHLLFTKLSTNIFCILQVISVSFILSTVEHWDTFIFALFVRKTCTLYDMVLKRHKMNSPNFKVYSTIYISVPVRIKWEKLWTLTNKTSISHCMNFLDLRMLSKVILLPYPGAFKIQKGNYHYQLTE